MEKICPNCASSLQPSHGNQVYCSPDCYQEYKAAIQQANNLIVKELRDGFLSNCRLFRELLPVAGRVRIGIHKLLKKGFDQDAFYGTVISKDGIHWHKVNHYMFSVIEIKGEPFLELYKS